MKTDTRTSAQERKETETRPGGGWQSTNEDSKVTDSHRSALVTTLKKCSSFPVLLGALLVGANFFIERTLRLDPDIWWHIKYGDVILKTGHWPTADIYSFTAYGVPHICYEWVGNIAIALAYRLGGLRGMDVLLVVLTSAIALLIYYYAWLRCGNSKAALMGAFVALPLAMLCFTLRPQLLGFIFLMLTLICLERYRQGRQKTLWVLAPIFLIWVNTHGTFALGLFIFGVYWISGWTGFSLGGLKARRWRPDQRIHLALVFLLSLLVLPITPYGTRLAYYPINMAFSQPVNIANIQEWQPLPLDWWQSKLLLLLLLAFIVAVAALRPTYHIEELGLFLFATYATFVHLRFAILFAMLFGPIFASLVTRWAPSYQPDIDKFGLNAVLVAAIVLGMVAYFPSETQLGKKVAKTYPVKAVAYLRKHSVPRPMFNYYGFGGYLLWSLGPKQKVFIDGRGDLYEETGVLSDYGRVMDLKPETLAILHSYGVKSCMIPPKTPLATLLSDVPGWKRIYADKVAAIFVRSATTTPITASPSAGR